MLASEEKPDKRDVFRVTLAQGQGVIHVVWPESDTPQPCPLLNLSGGGALLATPFDEKVQIGLVLEARLQFDKTVDWPLQVRVCHLRTLSDGQLHVGVEFLNLTEEKKKVLRQMALQVYRSTLLSA